MHHDIFVFNRAVIDKTQTFLAIMNKLAFKKLFHARMKLEADELRKGDEMKGICRVPMTSGPIFRHTFRHKTSKTRVLLVLFYKVNRVLSVKWETSVINSPPFLNSRDGSMILTVMLHT